MQQSGEVQPGASDGTAPQAPRRPLGQRLLRPLIQAVVMAGLLLLLLRLVDVSALSAAYARADLRMLPLAVGLLIASIAARTVRLWILTGCRSGFLPVFHAHNIGMAVNNLLPLRAGEVVTALILGRVGGVRASAALSIIAIDRVLDILVLLVFYAAVVFFTPQIAGNVRHADTFLIIVVLGVAIAMWLVQSHHERVRALLGRLLSHVSSPRRESWQQRAEGVLEGLQILRDRRTMVMALLWSPPSWLLSFAACYLVLRGFWPDAPLTASVLAVSLSALSVSLVTVPAGVGVMHASLFFSVALFGMDHESALLFAIVYHAVILLLTSALGLIGLRPAGLTIHELAIRLRRRRQ
jgi:uncharacterized protein (TIRG00374 family)